MPVTFDTEKGPDKKPDPFSLKLVLLEVFDISVDPLKLPWNVYTLRAV